MAANDQILEALDKYLKNVSKEELNECIQRVNSLGFKGISWENYLEGLSVIGDINTSNCESSDLQNEEFYQTSILRIEMETLISTIKSRNFATLEQQSYFREDTTQYASAA